jgi:hypothetical protein
MGFDPFVALYLRRLELPRSRPKTLYKDLSHRRFYSLLEVLVVVGLHELEHLPVALLFL